MNGLSALAIVGLVVGAVFVLTANQGCLPGSSGYRGQSQPPAVQPHRQPDDDSRKPTRAPRPESATTKRYSEDQPPTSQGEASKEEGQMQKEPSHQMAGPDASTKHTHSAPLASAGEVSRGSADSPRIAITLDAGAASAPVEKILRALTKHGVRCTFFLTGRWIEQNPALARRIADQGHEIGNHSYSHPDFTRISDAEIVKQLSRTEELSLRLIGRSTKPLFRAPSGARDKRVLGLVGGEGYSSIYWDVDSWDAFKRGITSEQITERVLDRVRNGSIILMHCGSQPTADALDGLLAELKSRGYQPVAVSELLGYR